MDHLRSVEQNKVREKNILEYNSNAAKMLKLKHEHNKEKDKYHSEEFNNFVEAQAINHKINLTSQKEKYESKRQQKDFVAIKNRTNAVKNTIEEIIDKYKENEQTDSAEYKELMQMQTAVRKWINDLESGENITIGGLDSFSRDIHNKTNSILSWQINNKKIAEIEQKLKDKEYVRFIKQKIDTEINEVNRMHLRKKEAQKKYLFELQQQDKLHKLRYKANAEKIKGFDLNRVNEYSENALKRDLASTSTDSYSSKRINRSFDNYNHKIDSPKSEYKLMQVDTNNASIEK